MTKTFDAILYSDKNPLLADKHGEDYYAPVFRKLGITEEAFDSHYQINYDLPILSTKVKCLKRWIDNDITTTLNKLLSPDEQPSQNRVLFHRKKLYDSICNYLTDIKNLVKKHNLDLDALLITKDYSQTPQLNECTYVFHYMILALIRCYMEFQQHFIEYIEKDKQLSVSDFFIQVLQWKEPSKVGITEIQHIIPVIEQEVEQDSKKKKRKTTKPVLAFYYTKLQGESGNINKLFNNLKKHGAIPNEHPITEFKRLFSGVAVSKPIPWIGNIGDLYYLFYLLMNEHKVLKKAKNANLWVIVDASFVDGSNNHFGNVKLRTQKKPKETKADIEFFAEMMA